MSDSSGVAARARGSAVTGGSRSTAGRPCRPRGSGAALGGAQQLADLPGVEQPGPPVEPDAPEGEGPAEDLGELGHGALTVAEQQQRERVEQVEGGGLPEEVDRERAVPTGAQQRHQQPHQCVAQRQRHRQPPRDDVTHGQAHDHGQDVEPVGDRVEDLPQDGGLPEPSSQPAVEPVGDPRQDQQPQRPGVGLGTEHQPEEDRDPGQPDGAEQVGQGPHPCVRPRRRSLGHPQDPSQ